MKPPGLVSFTLLLRPNNSHPASRPSSTAKDTLTPIAALAAVLSASGTGAEFGDAVCEVKDKEVVEMPTEVLDGLVWTERVLDVVLEMKVELDWLLLVSWFAARMMLKYWLPPRGCVAPAVYMAR